MGALDGGKPVGTKASKEKRQWIYAKKPSGKLYNYRQVFGYALLLFFLLAPFLKIKGNPMLMFNMIDRKFSIFGSLFYPQDLYLFVFGSLILLVGIVLFTAVFGRVWCGWACPQTIFLELVFRRIEYWIEGDWTQQKRLNEGPDSDARAWKKLLKHSIFFLISFIISNVFLAYIIGADALFKIATDGIASHIVGFISIIVFSFAFYGVFANVREIVCTTICPYGRLQSVLLDEQSMTVAYDFNRGEPRGRIKKGTNETKGDCIDCKLCVHVCPTGIDIREGTQMECVSCTACIDACDAVMDKLGKPKRLIGFYSMRELQEPTKETKKYTTRAIAYSLVLLVLTAVFGLLLFNRSALDGRLLRASGSTYQLGKDGNVRNLYTLEIFNKSGSDLDFELKPQAGVGLEMVNSMHLLKKEGRATLSFFLYMDQANVVQYKQDIKVHIISEGKIMKSLKTTFIAPPKKK